MKNIIRPENFLTDLSTLAYQCANRTHTEAQGELFYKCVLEIIHTYEWQNDDLEQICFTAVWEKLPGWNGKQFHKWCWGVCRKCLIEFPNGKPVEHEG